MRRPVRTRPRAERGGFTLIEVVLAMGILTIGMTALLGLFTGGAVMTRTAQLRTASAATLESVVVDLEERLFPLEPDGSVGEPLKLEKQPVPGAPGVLYSAVAKPLVDGPANRFGDPLEYRVDVSMAWQAGGVERKQTFQTVLLREVPFGERMRQRFVAPQR